MKALSEIDWWKESNCVAFSKAKSLVLYLGHKNPCCGIGLEKSNGNVAWNKTLEVLAEHEPAKCPGGQGGHQFKFPHHIVVNILSYLSSNVLLLLHQWITSLPSVSSQENFSFNVPSVSIIHALTCPFAITHIFPFTTVEALNSMKVAYKKEM